MQDPGTDAAAALAVNDKADRARTIRCPNVGQSRRPPPQHATDLPAGRIVGVQHAPRAVRALDRQRRIAVGVAVEGGAPLHQLADVAWPVADEHFHRARVAQPVAGRHRVGGMQRGRVAGSNRGCDASLGIAGVALARLRFRQDRSDPAPESSTAARRPAMPLPMMRKSACRSTPSPILLSYHPRLLLEFPAYFAV